ncbi:hypothetical protein MnTg02_01093 [bacterium MnTg02]|nr:hypothetical protein MnTg02_01093 [bacterium MnTg02]
MVLELDSRTIGDHWQARPRGPRLMAVKPAWRLNAYRSFLMSDDLIPTVLEFDSGTVGKRDCVACALWRVSLRGA